MFEYTIIAITVAVITVLIIKTTFRLLCYRLENKLNKVKREILVRKFKIAMIDYMLEQICINANNLSKYYNGIFIESSLHDLTMEKCSNLVNVDLDVKFKNIVELNKIYRDKLYGQF